MLKERRRTDPVERFLGKFSKQASGCWTWCGYIYPNGYGSFAVGSKIDGSRKSVLAHRFSYEAFVGIIPEGLSIDHLCRNRACVNPDHLEPVTSRENLMRGETLAAANAAKRSCPAGHPYDADNTYVTKNGKRQCRTCHAVRERERQRRRRKSTC